MQEIPSKSDSTAGANGVLPASEYNDRNVEIEKVVTKSNQTLSAGITDQFSKAIFINAIGAASMIDSGSGNTITLNPVTGGSGLVPPDDYADFNGGVVCFNKADPNTGTAVTIAPWGLSAKSLVRKDGSLPHPGDVIGTCYAKWDNSADKWVLMRNETDTYGYEIAASGAFVQQFANNVVLLDVSIGNVDIDALSLSDFIGQHVHFYAVGSGIGSIAGGNGVYVNGIFITENTGGAHLWGVSGGLWKADNVITADFVSGGINIEQNASGMIKSILTISETTDTSVGASWFTKTFSRSLPVATISFTERNFTAISSIDTSIPTHARGNRVGDWTSTTIFGALHALADTFSATIIATVEGKY